MVNLYDLLKVAPTAPEEEIKKAINKELRIWSNRTNAPQIQRRQEAERMVKLLEEAENTLLNATKRAEYDRQFKSAPKDERHIDEAEFTGRGDIDLIQEAWRLLIAGNVADALYVATRATQVQGNNPEAWAVLGQAKFRWGETEDAIYEYKRAIQLKPNEASYYFDLGSIYESVERWNDALQQYQRASQIDPTSAMYRAAIGILFIKNKKYKDGINILERCVREEPDNDTYNWFLAIAYVEISYENWTFIPEGQNVPSGYYATEKQHVEEAKLYIYKAEKLKCNDTELADHIRAAKKNIHSMYERKFYGNWIVTSIWFLLGLVLLGNGVNAGGGLFLLAVPSFYLYASRPPQFLLNRKVIKGISPSGGFDGIIWVILFYPIMAIWNFFNNYMSVGPLQVESSEPFGAKVEQPVRESANDEQHMPANTVEDSYEPESMVNTEYVESSEPWGAKVEQWARESVNDEQHEPGNTVKEPYAGESIINTDDHVEQPTSKVRVSVPQSASSKASENVWAELLNDVRKNKKVAIVAGVFVAILIIIGISSLGKQSSNGNNDAARSINITRSIIASGMDANQLPYGIANSFPPGSRKLYYYVSYTGGIPNETLFIFNWFKNGNEIGSSNVTLIYPSGNAWSNLGFDFQPGNYEVKLYAGGHEIKTISFEVVDPQVVQQSHFTIDRAVMTESLDSNNNPIGNAFSFSSDNKRLCYYVSYTGGIPSNNTLFVFKWYRNDDQIGIGNQRLIYASGNAWNYLDYDFQPGYYQAVLYADGKELNRIRFEIFKGEKEVFKPSFNCANATTPAERLICSNLSLAQADVQMAELYNSALQNTVDKDALRREQNNWRETERDVCTDVPCMLNAYQKRIAQLSNWGYDHGRGETTQPNKVGKKTDSSKRFKRFDKDIPLIP